MAPPLIFISYARQDDGALDKVVRQLRVLETQGLAKVWIDQRMELGEVWRPAIGEAIERASIAILLVSEHFLGSEFINTHERPRLLERSRYGNLLLLPVLLSPCDWQAAGWIEKRNLWPTGGKPLLTGRSPEEVQGELARLTREIRTHLSKQEARVEAVPGLLQFLDFHSERIQRMDWEENWAAPPKETWSESHFTDLEAELELEVKESRLRRWFEGDRIRRERRLARALVRSKERFIVLEGAPGSGKSVVLRKVAREVLKEARRAAGKSGHQPIRIPLYLPLRGFRPEGRPDAEAVRRFVIDSLGADAALLSDSLGRPGSRVQWLFLFDAFDEIPAVLSSTGEDNAVRDCAYALSDFITRTQGCSAMVGSRHFRGPTRFGWTKYRLLPLTDEQRAELTKRYLQDGRRVEQVLNWLDSSEAGMPVFGTNPLMLAMLCAWFGQENKSPGHPHEVFNRFLDEKLSRHAGELRTKGLTPGDIRKSAEALAFCMSADASLGLEPAHEELAGSMRRQSLPTESLPKVLEALRELRLARRGVTSAGQPSFAFVHRRFQEFLSTRWVQAEPTRVPLELLFRDYRWRETCVVLLQTASGPFFDTLLAWAEATLDEALALMESPWARIGAQGSRASKKEPGDQEEGYGAWPEGVRHLLELLQEGLRERLDDAPGSLREKVATVVRSAYRSPSLLDQREALEVAGLVPAAALEELLISALESNSQVLTDTAYRQAAWLRHLPEPVAEGIRVTLTELEISGQLPLVLRRTKVHVSRLPGSREFKHILRLLQFLRPVRGLLYFSWLSVSLVLSRQSEPSLNKLLWTVVATAWSVLHLSWSLQAYWVQTSLSFRRHSPGLFITTACMIEGFALLLLGSQIGTPPVALFLVLGVVSWDAYAYLACLNGKWTTAWPLYPFWPVLFPRSLLSEKPWNAIPKLALIILALYAIVRLTSRAPMVLAVFLGALGCYILYTLVQMLVYLASSVQAHIRSRRIWKRVEHLEADSLDPKAFLDWLNQFESPQDRVRFTRLMQSRNAVRPVNIRVLSDFIAANPTSYYQEVAVLDELCRLFDNLKARQNQTKSQDAQLKNSGS